MTELKGAPLDDLWELATGEFLDKVEDGLLPYAEQLPTARRITWEMTHGYQVPEGFWLRHDCKTRACVNPAHAVLEPVGG